MRNYQRVTFGITLLLFSVFQWEVRGEEVKKVLLSEEALWPPYTYETSGTATKGMSLDLMKALFSRLNIEMELRLFPQQRCIQQMQEGSRDAMTLISKNKTREEFLDYTAPILEDQGLIYYSIDQKTPLQWKTFEDLKAYRVGIVSGYNYGDAFKEAWEKYHLRVDPVTTIGQNFQKLNINRIDLMLANQAEASEFIRNNPEYKGRFKTTDKPYLSYSYHMAFSKKSPAKALIPQINDTIQKMKDDGSLSPILAKYLQ